MKKQEYLSVTLPRENDIIREDRLTRYAQTQNYFVSCIKSNCPRKRKLMSDKHLVAAFCDLLVKILFLVVISTISSTDHSVISDSYEDLNSRFRRII